MSSGRKKADPPKIEAPPQITKNEFLSPLGDRFITEAQGSTQTSYAELSPMTQALADRSRFGMWDVLDEIDRPTPERQAAINQRADDFYNLQARGVNQTFDDILKRTQSDLSQRFGGAYNATFGTDMLSRVERGRAASLGDSRQQANLLAEDLNRDDEAERVQRFTLFSNYLGDLNNQAQGLGSLGIQTLNSERTRATDLAITRANMLDRASSYQNDAAERRKKALETAAKVALAIAL